MGLSDSPRLVGRADELDVLGRWIRRAAGAGAAVALVEGEAGIGKTRLLDELCERARDLGFAVTRGRGDHLERGYPFGVVAEALDLRPGAADPERARLGRLLVEAGEPEPITAGLLAGPGPRLRPLLVEGIVGLVERLALRRPLLIAIDDLHWADPSSLLGIRTLVRRLAYLPIALLAAFRPAPRVPELRALRADLRGRDIVRLRIEPLTADEVDVLVGELAGAPPGERLRQRAMGAGGNPFLVTELVRSLRDKGAMTIRAGSAEIPDRDLPPALRRVLLDRMNHLPGETERALRIASVLGMSFRVGDLCLVGGRPSAELMPALEEALRAGLLREAAGKLAFAHDLVREAVYEDIASPIRASLHREAARRLAEAGEPAIRIAEHLALGAPPGDREAVRRLREAAREAAQHAPAVAVEFLEKAVEIAGPGTRRREALLSDLVTARVWSGRPAEAEALAREAIARGHDDPDTIRLRLGLIQALVAQGKFLEGYRESENAARRPDLPATLRPWLRAWTAWGRVFMWDLPGAIAMADQARSAGRRLGDDLATCAALCALAQAELYRGRSHDGLALATKAVERAGRLAGGTGLLWPCEVYLAYALMSLDRFTDAEEALRRGLRRSERSQASTAFSFYHWAMAWRHSGSGQWDDAIAEAHTTIALAAESGARICIPGMRALLATIAVHRNNLRPARRELALAEDELTSSGASPYTEFVLYARAVLAEASGDPARALHSLETAWRLFTRTGVVAPCVEFGPYLVRLYVAAGRPTEAHAVSDQVGEVAARQGTATARSAALRCRGLATGDPQTLLGAAHVARDSPRPFARAGTDEDAATALAAAGRTAEATELFDAALSAYQDLDAHRDEARVRAALRLLGVRRRRPHPRRPATGWAALTPTELAVVRLLAEGLTNREAAARLYISPRTVETHVGHIFAKLGISTRAALLADARTQELIQLT